MIRDFDQGMSGDFASDSVVTACTTEVDFCAVRRIHKWCEFRALISSVRCRASKTNPSQVLKKYCTTMQRVVVQDGKLMCTCKTFWKMQACCVRIRLLTAFVRSVHHRIESYLNS